MTQDEIIRMARELATRHGSCMCDENGETHGEELYCVGVEDIAEIIKQVAAHVREACAKVCEEIEQDRWNLYKGRLPYTGTEAGRADPHEQGVSMGAGECAAAIRAINFEGDTGFRPISEMIAEHKQDPKKKAAIERAELRKQVAALKAVVDAWNNVEQEPVAWVDLKQWQSGEYDCFTSGKVADYMTPLYTTPVRTKDLTDDEIEQCNYTYLNGSKCCYIYPSEFDDIGFAFARAVIAKDRELNK